LAWDWAQASGSSATSGIGSSSRDVSAAERSASQQSRWQQRAASWEAMSARATAAARITFWRPTASRGLTPRMAEKPMPTPVAPPQVPAKPHMPPGTLLPHFTAVRSAPSGISPPRLR
jgi:hypothetical protein